MANKLGQDDLFVVQAVDSIHINDSQVYETCVSVKYETIATDLTRLALPGYDSLDGAGGTQGTMFPGKGFYYDAATGQLDAKVDTDLTFVNTISNDTQTPDDFTPPSASDYVRGNFFVVGDEDFVLDRDSTDSVKGWQPFNGSAPEETELGDLVVCVDVNDTATGSYEKYKWNVIPSITGGQAVLQVNASARDDVGFIDNDTQLVDVDVSSASGTPQRPLVKVRIAHIETDTNGGVEFIGGLLNSNDYQKVSELDPQLIDDGWVHDLHLATDSVTTESLDLAEMAPGTQYKNYVLGQNQATDSQFGATRFATNDLVEAHIGDSQTGGAPQPDSPSRSMTVKTTFDNFIPKDFKSLKSLELSP